METRKEFIIKSLRLAAFSVIATSTGYLIFNGKVTNNCEFEFACSNCKKKGCSTRKEEFKEVSIDKQIKK
jgi:positive regulator of sigma E activity